MSPPYHAKPRCSKLLHYVEMYFNISTKYLTTELTHSKLNMVYLAELLVVMTDRLKIVRIRARNVPRKRTQAPIRRGVSRISLSLQESDGVAC